MEYTTAAGDTLERIERYLGFSSQVVDSAPTKHGQVAAIIAFKPEDARWQTERLGSGMMGGHTIYSSLDLARTMFELIVDCG